jgi:hypothetical protein
LGSGDAEATVSIAELKERREAIRDRLDAAEATVETYEGGAIADIARMRVETLKLTVDLLTQRIVAEETGAPRETNAPVTEPALDRAEKLEMELARVREEIARKAKEKQGGLLGTLSLMTLATKRQTAAMLEQGMMAARYGLPYPALGIAPGSSPSSPGDVDPKDPLGIRDSAQGDGDAGAFRTGSADSEGKNDTITHPVNTCLSIADNGVRVLDRNDIFTRVTWKVKVANSCDRAFLVRVRFAFLDDEEFRLDEDDASIRVPAGSDATAREEVLLNPANLIDDVGFTNVRLSLPRQ